MRSYQMNLYGAVFIMLVILNMKNFAVGEPMVPCYFVFGDSLVDNGNNNELNSLAKANYVPYGVDFPGGPTGRFSNGRTSIDVTTELLGFDAFILPHSTATGEDILRGVNYASAAGGIREETSTQYGERLNFAVQVKNHGDTIQQIVNLLGNKDNATNYLSKCIYSINMGSNDYLNNYFMPLIYSSFREYSPEQWADVLLQEYNRQLSALYDFGARKFALNGVGQVGCTPSELSQNSIDGETCVANINDANQIFNNKLKALVDQLNKNRTDAKFTFINVYGMFEDIMKNPSKYGFTVTNDACCGVGRNNALITCLPNLTPCQNRAEYVFWDAFHPTEATNAIIGKRSFSAQYPDDAYPMDIRSLAEL